MEREELERRRAQLGPWVADNIDLGHGVFTMQAGVAGAAEARVARAVQIVADVAGDPAELRILDLGALEGGFSVELARRGAEVVAVEGRAAHAAKIAFARDALGLDRLSVVEGDVRRLDATGLGTFDVVLCLGILYHLETVDAAALVELVATCTRRLAIVETQVGLAPRASFEHGGHTYRGVAYREDVAQPAASLDNRESFWLTRPSLLNLLERSGFTSISESLTPFVPAISAYRDHVTLVAAKGTRVAAAEPWPERHLRIAHPAQGWRFRLQNALLERRGRGLAGVFKSEADRGD